MVLKAYPPKEIPELADIYREINYDLEAVEDFLKEITSSSNPFLAEINRYLFKKKGKRLRPALVILSTKLFDYNGQDHILMASLVECIHTASLIHDDIIDNSRIRRGQSTVHARWGTNLSVLLGDHLYIQAINLLLESGHDEIIRLLSRTVSQMIEGEINEFIKSGNFDLTEGEYLEIIRKKTASLFGASCSIGGLLARAGQEELNQLENFGLCLGLAFQIIDDILDYLGDEKKLGKPTFSDLNEGRITLPIIHSLNCNGHPFREKIIDLARNRPLGDKEKQAILQFLQESDSFTYSFNLAKEFVLRGQELLTKLPFSSYRQSLESLANYILYRHH
ncbi:MAG: polyprenyl synthetase family protein [Candidatus Aminicenantes bacterium]|nr:polyprenyl synthetase family protein [Candidatus Aminicenantes bacterium]